MHKFFMLGAVLLGIAGSVISAQVDIDDDFMRSVEDANKALANHIAVKDGKAVQGDTQELAAMFAQVEAYYQAKADADDAVTITKKSRQLISDIDHAVASKDFDSANVMASDLSRACKSCHNFYKKS